MLKQWTSTIRKRDTLAFYLFISPWIVGFLLFAGGPIIASLYLSFTDYNVISPANFIGAANFKTMFSEPLFAKSLGNTAYYAFFFIVAGLIFAVSIAMLLNQKVRGLAIYRTVFYLPVVVPVVASSVLWLWIFNSDGGLINAALRAVGIEGPGWLASEGWVKPSIIIMSVWALGNWIIICLAGLQGIPRQLYEAAEVDGAGPVRKFWHVTIPILTPTILFLMITGLIGAFQVFTQAYIMTNGGPVNASLFYALYMFREAFNYLNMGYGSALAWFLFIVILSLTLLQFKVANRWVHYG